MSILRGFESLIQRCLVILYFEHGKEVCPMLEYLKDQANLTLTENQAVTYKSTGSACLDLFATVGALRRADDREIILRFTRALAENPNDAMKILFFARDIRDGLGERRVFRVILKWLAENQPGTVRKNMGHIATYGRFDDLLVLFDTPCERDMLLIIQEQFRMDMAAWKKGENVSLLAKWLPSVNASSAETVKRAKKIAGFLGMNDATYRKALVALRARIGILENNLRVKDYTFDYEKQPSRAMFKYRQAFLRNDEARYRAFLSNVSSGKATLHADNIAPYELIQPYISGGWDPCGQSFMRKISKEEKETLNATWASLPDFGGEENALAVVDTSGSMYWAGKPLPAAVALSLGLYFAEHNQGLFKNHFIEFSQRPQLIEIKGKTFADRLRYVATFNEVANTNLEAVFDLILNAAVRHRVPADELPAKLIIISDMEFDRCVANAKVTNFQNAKEKYQAHGYPLPDIVFWNVASRNRQQPVRMNEQGVALVSGVTPRLFSMIAGGKLSPLAFMLEVLHSERYADIVA